MWMVLVLASCLILAAGPAPAEMSFVYGSHGESATIVSPGDGSMSFYYGSDGTTGTIIHPGGGMSFYYFNQPGGQQQSGTILTYPRSPRPAAPPPIVAPVQPLVPTPAPPLRGNPPASSRWPDWPR